jgi:GntR family transcriptional regulator/MocR family aminotransferase
MLTYQLHQKGDRSLYEQLYRAIRDDIECQRLPAGYKLPSKRLFAAHLGVSVITIENAYRQLVAEGYVESRERKGYFVNELPSMPQKPKTRKVSSRKNMRALDDGALLATKLDRATPLLADFSGTHRSGSIFPFPVWAKTVRRTLNEASKGHLLQTAHDNCGAEELRVAIADHLAGFRGLNISPEQIIIGAGAQDLYGILVQLLGRNRTFAIEDPGYPTLRAHYELNDVSLATIAVDDEGMSVADLEMSQASIAHCTPAHQFPTGVVMSAPRRRELLDWADRGSAAGRCYIVEDDYDSEFRMHGRPIPPLLASDAHESVIYLNTFTRSLGSVFRIAYMVLPPHLMREFRLRFASRSCMVGALEQLELAHFIVAGDYERHVNRQRATYRRLQDDLVARLSTSAAGPYLHFRGVDAGLHFLMDIDLAALSNDAPERDQNLCTSTLEQRALGLGIRLANIESYRFSNQARSDALSTKATYVMNVAGLDREQAQEITEALICALLQR